MAKVIDEKKSTKTEIFEAYQQALLQIQEKESVKFDPSAQAVEMKSKETIKKVEGVKVMDLQSLVNEISGKVTSLSENLNVYNETVSAIEIRKQELKKMFDIESSAYSLSALVNSQAELKEKFNAEMETKKAELKNLVDMTNEQISEAKKIALVDIKKLQDEEKLSRKKETETYEYDTARKRKIDTDKFNDDLASKTKVYDDKIKDLVARETTLKELESQIESLKAEMATSIDKATKEAKASADKSNTFEVNMLKKTHEGTVALLDSKIETLTLALADSKQTISTLTSKLDDAYAKIEAMAKATIDGAGSKDMIATLKTALSDKGNGGK